MKTELKIMLNRRTFKITFTIMMLMVVYAYLFYTFKYRGEDISKMISVEWLYIFSLESPVVNALMTIFPFVAIIPYGFSAFYDRQTHTDVLMDIRSNNKKKHLWNQYITCFISGFIVVTIPFLIGIFLNYITFKNTGWKAIDYYGFDNYSALLTGEADYTEAITKKGLSFLRLYMLSPVMYNIFYAIIAGILSGVCSMFNYALSLMVKRYKILILLPSYILLYILGYLKAIIGYSGVKIETNLLEYLVMDITCGKYWIYFVSILIAMILISAIIVKIVSRKELSYE